MKLQTFICPHSELHALCKEIYCRQCRSLIFSIEETKKREMKLAQLIYNNPKIVITIKFLEKFI